MQDETEIQITTETANRIGELMMHAGQSVMDSVRQLIDPEDLWDISILPTMLVRLVDCDGKVISMMASVDSDTKGIITAVRRLRENGPMSVKTCTSSIGVTKQ